MAPPADQFSALDKKNEPALRSPSMKPTEEESPLGLLERLRSRLPRALAVAAALTILVLIGLFPGPTLQLAASVLVDLRDGLQEVPPGLYLLAFAILPVTGFPLTIFYLTVGEVMGSLWLALPLAWLAVLVNMALTYALVRGILHAPLARWVERRGWTVPSLAPDNEWKVIVLLRASPTPWLLQSVLLSLAGARLIPYLAWSLPVQGLIGASLIVFGQSALEGQFGPALLGLFCFLLVSMALSALWKRARRGRWHGA